MREKVCLNGLWSFMPINDEKSDDDTVRDCVWGDRGITVPSSWIWKLMDSPYQLYNVFGYPEEWNNAKSGVFCVYMVGNQPRSSNAAGGRAP